jgi:D-alanyl-D-alanine carboxypeptidase (penicillin-binding protein 5/6)
MNFALELVRSIFFLAVILVVARAGAADLPIPAPPKVAAKGYLLIDHHTGRVLAEHNADERLEPASLTKILSAYVVFRELAEGNIGLKDEVLVSKKAWQTPGSRMFIEVGKKVSLEDLLIGMIVQSGNDASVALAEHVAGSESTFAELMNTHAKRLGMENSHFVNATGLPDPDHYITARDIAIATAATIREFPEYYAWYAVKEYTFNGIKQHNRNRLLWQDDAVDGVKTGHTEAAGYCLVASAQRDDMRLTSVVMGAAGESARAKASLSMLNYGFRFFESHKLYASDKPVQEIRVWKGEIEDLPVTPQRDVYVTIPRGQYDNLTPQVSLESQVLAPVEAGQTLGHVIVNLGEEEVARVPLVPMQPVAEGGIWQHVKDSVLLWFE